MSEQQAISSARRLRATATFAYGLRLLSVSRRFGQVLALDQVNLDVEPGEIVTLLGHSGCGKTTLLRIAAGVERPTSGTVMIDDIPVSSEDIFLPPEQRNIGLMFQDYALFPHLTLLKNVMFGLTALDRKSARNEALAALARVGIDHLRDAYPHEVSGGEQQRTALARAIVPRPGILLMDEPFSGLDSRLRDSVRHETLTILRESGATAIFVTHDPEEAMDISDRIVLMRKGRIAQIGTPESLYNAPQDLFAARYFSQINEIPGKIVGHRVETDIGSFNAGGNREGTDVVVAIRPQGVHLSTDPAAPGRPGRIVSRRFLGEVNHFDVAVQGLETYLLSRGRAKDHLVTGSEVKVSFDPRDVLVFTNPRVG